MNQHLSATTKSFMNPTRGVIAIQDIKEEGNFVTPIQKGDLRKGKVIAVGDFLFHICAWHKYSPRHIRPTSLDNKGG